ncbi:hypothetical protein ACOSOMT5_P1070 [Acidiphilium sp. MT5]
MLFRARDHRGLDGDRPAGGDRRRTRRPGPSSRLRDGVAKGRSAAEDGRRTTFLSREEWADWGPAACPWGNRSRGRKFCAAVAARRSRRSRPSARSSQQEAVWRARRTGCMGRHGEVVIYRARRCIDPAAKQKPWTRKRRACVGATAINCTLGTPIWRWSCKFGPSRWSTVMKQEYFVEAQCVIFRHDAVPTFDETAARFGCLSGRRTFWRDWWKNLMRSSRRAISAFDPRSYDGNWVAVEIRRRSVLTSRSPRCRRGK